MADHGILFSAPMVRALLAGSKTQTRRALSIRGHRSFSQFGPSDTRGYDWHFRDAEKRWHDYRAEDLLKRLPHVVGDRLWVREHWRVQKVFDDWAPVTAKPGKPRLIPKECAVRYVADDPRDTWLGKHRQAMHMPRWASRITLTVTEVRVQRLQEISPADAMAEGGVSENGEAPCGEGYRDAFWFNHGQDHGESFDSPIESYRDLWNSLHGHEAWETNPWLASTTFTVRLGNIDQVEA